MECICVVALRSFKFCLWLGKTFWQTCGMIRKTSGDNVVFWNYSIRINEAFQRRLTVTGKWTKTGIMVLHNEESVVHKYILKSIILAEPCKEAFLAVCDNLSMVNTLVFGSLEIGCTIMIMHQLISLLVEQYLSRNSISVVLQTPFTTEVVLADYYFFWRVKFFLKALFSSSLQKKWKKSSIIALLQNAGKGLH